MSRGLPGGQQWHPMPSDLAELAADPRRGWMLLAYAWALRTEYRASQGACRRPSGVKMLAAFKAAGANRSACDKILSRVRADMAYWKKADAKQRKSSGKAAEKQAIRTSAALLGGEKSSGKADAKQKKSSGEARARSSLFTTKDPPIVPQGTKPKKPAGKRATAAARRLSMAQSVEVSPELLMLDGWVEAWGNYCEMRQSKARGSWAMPKQVQAMLTKLLKSLKAGFDPVAALQASFASSYQGVFPEKHPHRQAHKSSQSGSSVLPLRGGQRAAGIDEGQATAAIRKALRLGGIKKTIATYPEGQRAPLRAAFTSLGSWSTVRQIKSTELPFRARTFRDAYNRHTAGATA